MGRRPIFGGRTDKELSGALPDFDPDLDSTCGAARPFIAGLAVIVLAVLTSLMSERSGTGPGPATQRFRASARLSSDVPLAVSEMETSEFAMSRGDAGGHDAASA